MNKKILIIPIIIAISLMSFFLFMNYNEQSQLNDDIFFQDANLNSKLLKANGEDHTIIYGITNGELIDMQYSEEMNSLNLNLDTTSDGVVSLTIPREFFDYPEDAQGHSVMIIHNGEEIAGVDTSDDLNHIVHFDYVHPDPKIEIIGAFYP